MPFDAVDFANASADMAIDQRRAHMDVQDAIDSYRENVLDTMAEHHTGFFEYHAALAAFDARIVSLRAEHNI